MARLGLASALALSAATTLTGCFEPTQNGGVATPAAQKRSTVDRPVDFEFSPPVRIAINKDAIVRLVAGGVTCSGTLIAEDQVLTAHHCVSARDERGRVEEQDVTPEALTIELGGSYLPWGEVLAHAIVSPDCGYERGEGDIAIVVLNRKLVGMPTLVPRVDSPPPKGDTIYPWGYGRCALSHDPVHLVSRTGGTIDSLYRSEFLGQASICPGDSGGPALTINDELVGIVSTSVMDYDDRTLGLTHYTRLDVWRSLFAAAREISNGASPSELPPYRSCRF
jgi:hypothetical protein